MDPFNIGPGQMKDLGTTSKFDGNSLSLQCKDRGGGGPEILSCKDMNSSQNRQITAK